MCFIVWSFVIDILYGFMLYRGDNYLWLVFSSSKEKYICNLYMYKVMYNL